MDTSIIYRLASEDPGRGVQSAELTSLSKSALTFLIYHVPAVEALLMAHDIRTSELKKPIDVAEYLFRRLHQLGVRSVHGVPGDYNLVALDYLDTCDLNWVGNCNELNAGVLPVNYSSKLF